MVKFVRKFFYLSPPVATISTKIPSPRIAGGEGTGLGLSIGYDIISSHGGKLMIDSVEGEFTKVAVVLPARGKTKT